MKDEQRPMTPEETAAATALQQVTYPVASWDKRFAKTLSHRLTQTPPLISERMVPQLWRLMLRYRRQWTTENKRQLLALADKLSAPDFRKQNAALQAKARIDQMKAEAANG